MDGDDLPAPRPARSGPSTKTTVGVLVAMVVVIIVAGLGISRVRDAQRTLRQATALVTTTTTTPGSSGATAPAGASDMSPEQQKAIDEVKAQVSSIRGLAWKATLPMRVVSKDELAKRLKDLNAQDRAKHPDRLATDASVLKLLQLIPKNVDYAKAIDDLLAGGVLGFYDDEAKELFVAGNGSGTPDPATRATLSHELTHALTDQYFDFGTRGRALDDANRTEESAALGALIEGDAELVRTMWEDKYLSSSERQQADARESNDGGAYDKAPPYLLDALFFPYQDGVAFVRSRFKAGGFAAVDDAYRNPPTSTEQILHPEMYSPGKGWTAPPLPDLAAATGCGKVDTGTLGEFDMAELLDRQLTSAAAHAAAAGWSGDAYGVVRCGAALGLADRWQADNPTDAGLLADALTKWSKGWSGSSKAPDAEGRFAGPNGAGRIVQSPTGRVDLVLADDVATVDKLARAVAAA
jgi:hypothetical protein